MGAPETEILNKIVSETKSELILFFVIMTVALVVFLLPVYIMVMKDRREHRVAEGKRVTAEAEANNTRQDKYIEREKEIIRVITANTEVIAGLKATLEIMSTSTNTSLIRIHERLDTQQGLCTARNADVTKLQSTLDEAARNQTTMKSEIGKILLIVNGISNDRLREKEGVAGEKK